LLSVVAAVRDIGRLREISAVLVRHGFGEIVHRAGFGRTKRSKEHARGHAKELDDKPAPSLDAPDLPEIPEHEAKRGEDERGTIALPERARLVLQDLGPSFVKLGQIASTRSDVLPAELIVELKKLQDAVPPVPFPEIRQVVESSLGDTLEDLYVSFDEAPLAAASIGQVHRAVLDVDGEHVKVVVKVQRPGVGATVARDLELLHVMAAMLERGLPETKIYSPVGLVQQFDRSITSELNFVIEADNAERFAENFASRGDVRVPKVYRRVTSKHVLTLEFFDGVKVDRAVEAGYFGPEIARRATAVVVKMAFEDGFFHADPHPGNVIIMGKTDDPVIGLIDLGMVGRLSPELRDRCVDLMVAAVRKDAYAVADALYAIGKPTKKVDMREYRAHVALLAEKYLGRRLEEIDLPSMIRDLVQGAMKFGIEIPPDFLLVGKALMTIEGTGKELDPSLDVFAVAAPLFLELLRKRYSPQRIGNELIRGVGELSRAGYDMPMQAREVLEDLRLGRLAIRAIDPELPRAADRLGRRLFTALVVATLLGSGSLLISHMHDTIGIGMLISAGLVWLGHALVDLRRGPKAS